MFIFILSAFSIANNMFLRQTTITFIDKKSISFMSSKDASPEDILKKNNISLLEDEKLNVLEENNSLKLTISKKEKNNKEVYRITSKQSGEIILSKPYWRGYTAKINGKKVIITDEAGLLKLEIPGNINNGILELTYFPRSWRFTLWLALVGIIGIILVLINMSRKIRNSN